MPIVNVTSIYSCSSEDNAFPATNLLSKNSRKWRCKKPGEKQAFVILELNKPVQIVGIDIGNEYSAYVSVMVGRKGSAQDQDFKEILLASSFMTPSESKNATSPNRVRCFGKEGLIAEMVAEKWNLVKVICTQPYSTHVQYGISFIKLHASADSTNPKGATLVPDSFKNTTLDAAASSSPFARFKMRKDSSDSNSDSSTSLFQRWKQSKNKPEASDKSTSVAAAIRDSSSSVAPIKDKHVLHKRLQHNSPAAARQKNLFSDDEEDSTEKPKKVDRNRDSLVYDDEDDKPNAKWDRNLQRDLVAAAKQKQSASAKDGKARTQPNDKFKVFLTDELSSSQEAKKRTADEMRKKKEPVSNAAIAQTPLAAGKTAQPTASTSHKNASPTRPILTDKKPEKEKVYRPFNKLLEGVVLVISGIQNPLRGQLRDKALAMGSKYKPDWDDSCTHLICAFKNTPKYNQVHGHGKIIRKDWIINCYEKKKRFPWRRYALDSDETDVSESEDEILDIRSKPATTPTSKPRTASPVARALDIRSNVSDDETVISSDDDDRYNAKGEYNKSPPVNTALNSGSDTEDEIERVLKKQKTTVTNEKPSDTPLDDDEAYNKSTDDEKPAPPSELNDKSISPLPEFYKGKKFHLSRHLSSVDEIKLQRFITVYGGRIIKNAADADYIISDKPKALSSDFVGEVLKPLWVFECNDMECLLPTKRYKFT